MSKLILFLTWLCLAFLLALSMADPSNPLMMLASASQSYNIARVAIMFVLLVLFFTTPPRNVILRVFVGLLSTALGAWVVGGLYDGGVMPLDALSLLAASVASVLIVLELEDFDEENSVETNSYKLIHPHFGSHH